MDAHQAPLRAEGGATQGDTPEARAEESFASASEASAESSAVDRVVANTPNASTLKKHLIDSHTAAEDCGRVAEAAGVETLVLSHRVPSDDPTVTDQMWLDAARAHFRGTVLLARDLMEV